MTTRVGRSRSGGARPDRGVPASPAAPDRRRDHARPRRRRQGISGVDRRRVRRSVRRRFRRARWPTPPRLTLPTGERLAFTTDSFVVQPRHFPGGSIGHLAVHGTVNDLAVCGATPMWLSVAFVIEEGFPIAELREIVGRHGRGRRRRRASRSSPATPRWWARVPPTGCTSRPPAWASIPPDRRLGARAGATRRRRAALGQHGRPRHGRDAGPGRPRCSTPTSAPTRRRSAGSDRVRARRRAVDALDARSDAGRGRHRVQRAGPRHQPRRRARRDAAADRTRRSSAPATCWASIRCTSPTRARCVAVVAPDEADAALAAMRVASRSALDADADRRDHGRAAGDRRAAHQFRWNADRRHARRRPAPPHLLTPCRRHDHQGAAAGHRHGAGRRLPTVRLPPRGRAGSRRIRAERQRRCADRGRGSVRARRRAGSRAGRGSAAAGPSRRRHRRASASVWRADRVPDRRESRRRARPTCRSASTPAPVPTASPRSTIPTIGGTTTPFTNCTNCGPRYTIVLGVPYDRPATTMAGLHDVRRAARRSTTIRQIDGSTPSRTHARSAGHGWPGRWSAPRPRSLSVPTALDARGRGRSPSGRIVAMKGIGGYHLVADATDDAAVAELRRRKARDDKPFAVMVAIAGRGATISAISTMWQPRR